eukprot:102300_1
MAETRSASIDTGRFSNKDKEFEKRLNFPSILKQKVNMKKVVFSAIEPWIKHEIDSLLGFEDDVVCNLLINLLKSEQHADGQAITVKMMGFLEKDTMAFMTSLWQHLVDASNHKLGIPTKLLADAQKRQSQLQQSQIKIKKESKREPKQVDSMNSIWPPSPSPPAILSKRKRHRSRSRSRSRSPSHHRHRHRHRHKHRHRDRDRHSAR